MVYQMQVMVYQKQVGFQTWDDGVPGKGRVTMLMSHQSEILHSLIFISHKETFNQKRRVSSDWTIKSGGDIFEYNQNDRLIIAMDGNLVNWIFVSYS